MARLIGQQLGNYRLIRLLGTGAYAEVYLGEHIHLKRQAAIKVLRAALKDEQKADFVMEAQRMVDLLHPSIIPVFDFAIEGDFPYLIMEYAPNGTLRTRYPRGSRLALETVVSYVKRIAAPLQYLHDQNMVHRDVKPENLLVGRNQEILLSDFGIAAIAHKTNSLNIQGQAGTPPYMAPEQSRGMPRAASDQYALGIVAYEWLCGTVPFQGSVIALAVQHLSSPPPSLRQQIPTLPPAVEQVIFKALAKKPQQRFRTITEFAVALEQASQPTQTTRVVLPVKRNQIPLHISDIPTVLLAEPVRNKYSLDRESQPLRSTQPLTQLPQHIEWVQGRVSIENDAISRPLANSYTPAPRSRKPDSSVTTKANALWKRKGLSYMLGAVPLIVLILSASIAGFVTYLSSHASTSPIHQTPTAQPNQQNLLATDTFQRPGQGGWGTASDGQQWSIDATAQPYFSINNSTGIIAGGRGSLAALIGQQTADVDATVIGSVNQFGSADRSGDKVDLGIVLRWNSPDNWYEAYIDGNQLVIVKSVNGKQSVLGTKSVSVSAGVLQRLRFTSFGTGLLAKVWSNNESEPTDWQITVSDDTFATGQFGVGVFEQSTTVVRIASFSAMKGSVDQDT